MAPTPSPSPEGPESECIHPPAILRAPLPHQHLHHLHHLPRGGLPIAEPTSITALPLEISTATATPAAAASTEDSYTRPGWIRDNSWLPAYVALLSTIPLFIICALVGSLIERRRDRNHARLMEQKEREWEEEEEQRQREREAKLRERHEMRQARMMEMQAQRQKYDRQMQDDVGGRQEWEAELQAKEEGYARGRGAGQDIGGEYAYYRNSEAYHNRQPILDKETGFETVDVNGTRGRYYDKEEGADSEDSEAEDRPAPLPTMSLTNSEGNDGEVTFPKRTTSMRKAGGRGARGPKGVRQGGGGGGRNMI